MPAISKWKAGAVVVALGAVVAVPLAASATDAPSSTPAGTVTVHFTGGQLDAIASKAAKKCETAADWVYQDVKGDLPKPTPSVSPPSCPKPTKSPTPSPTKTPKPSPSPSASPSATPTPSASPTPTPTATAAPGSLPSQVLNLANWKVTLPVDKSGNAGSSCSPLEVTQPALASFTDQWFKNTAAGDGVVFRANVEGCTTSGSSYPRSELREMNGSALASWSSTSGTSTMTTTEAVTSLPPNKPQLVVGQIHASSDDLIEILADGTNMPAGTFKLAYRWLGAEQSDVLISSLTYGQRFTYGIGASGGTFTIVANDGPAHLKTKSVSGLYFKAGAYPQSNLSKGDKAGAYGETVIYALSATHS